MNIQPTQEKIPLAVLIAEATNDVRNEISLDIMEPLENVYQEIRKAQEQGLFSARTEVPEDDRTGLKREAVMNALKREGFKVSIGRGYLTTTEVKYYFCIDWTPEVKKEEKAPRQSLFGMREMFQKITSKDTTDNEGTNPLVVYFLFCLIVVGPFILMDLGCGNNGHSPIRDSGDKSLARILRG